MNFQRDWIRRDLPTEITTKPREPYVDSVTIRVNEGQDIDLDLKNYVRGAPQVLAKPYWLEVDGTHLKGIVPADQEHEYKIDLEDEGDD